MSIRTILNDFELMSTEWHHGDQLSAVFHHYNDGYFHVSLVVEDNGDYSWLPRLHVEGRTPGDFNFWTVLQYELRTNDELESVIKAVYELLDYDAEMADNYLSRFHREDLA